MARSNNQKNSPKQNNQAQSSRSKQNNQTRSAAGRFCSALINGNEEILNEMALYTQGGVGSSSSNISALQKAGVTGYEIINVSGNQATISFTGNGGAPAMGVFQVLGGKHVLADWDLYIKP